MRILANGKFVEMSGGGTWPTPMDLPDDSLEWRLRYAEPDQLVKDRFCAASIVSAYRQLIALPRTQREVVIRQLRAALKVTANSGRAEPEVYKGMKDAPMWIDDEEGGVEA